MEAVDKLKYAEVRVGAAGSGWSGAYKSTASLTSCIAPFPRCVQDFFISDIKAGGLYQIISFCNYMSWCIWTPTRSDRLAGIESPWHVVTGCCIPNFVASYPTQRSHLVDNSLSKQSKATRI